jgi:hypothetical protein
MKRLAAVLAALAVLGCAPADASYKRDMTAEFTPPAGRTPEQNKQDWGDCRLKTASSPGTVYTDTYDRIFTVCMESKGWALNPKYKP